MSIDPLATDFPQWSPYVFSGNLVTMTRELEGMEPSYLIGANGKLTQGAITIMNAAFSYTPKSLTNTTWIKDNDPRADIVQNSFLSNKGVIAVTSFSNVAYNRKYSGDTMRPEWWMGTIAHEQRHRSDIDSMGGLNFDMSYVSQAISAGFDENNMALETVGYKNDRYGKKLWSYNNGEVAKIFQTGNITENERSSMLESVGSRFRRDVILKDEISGISNLINNTTNLIKGLGNSDGDKSLKTTLNNLISSWQQSLNKSKEEQSNITNKYGK